MFDGNVGGLLKLTNLVEYEDFCCESCNNGDKNRRRKIITIHTGFTWFGNVPTSMRTTVGTFHYIAK